MGPSPPRHRNRDRAQPFAQHTRNLTALGPGSWEDAVNQLIRSTGDYPARLLPRALVLVLLRALDFAQLPEDGPGDQEADWQSQLAVRYTNLPGATPGLVAVRLLRTLCAAQVRRRAAQPAHPTPCLI